MTVTNVKRITIYGDEGTNYSWLERLDDRWETEEEFVGRYPNGEYEENDNTAVGILECISQSDDCPPFLYREGVKRVTITDPEGYF